VKNLIEGAGGVRICDECVEIRVQILKDGNKPAGKRD